MCRSFSLVAEARRAYRKTAAYRAYLEKRKSSLDYAWSQFRSHARRRGKEVAISKDDYCTLVKMPCAYTAASAPLRRLVATASTERTTFSATCRKSAFLAAPRAT